MLFSALFGAILTALVGAFVENGLKLSKAPDSGKDKAEQAVGLTKTAK